MVFLISFFFSFFLFFLNIFPYQDDGACERREQQPAEARAEASAASEPFLLLLALLLLLVVLPRVTCAPLLAGCLWPARRTARTGRHAERAVPIDTASTGAVGSAAPLQAALYATHTRAKERGKKGRGKEMGKKEGFIAEQNEKEENRERCREFR